MSDEWRKKHSSPLSYRALPHSILCGSLGLHRPSSPTGRGRFRPLGSASEYSLIVAALRAKWSCTVIKEAKTQQTLSQQMFLIILPPVVILSRPLPA